MEARAMLAASGQGHVGNDAVAKFLERKWGFMLEGIDASKYLDWKWQRRCLAQIMENQMAHLHFEARKSPYLMEASTQAAIPDYVKFVFPLVRRVWANLIANGLVSIQPMSAPIGGVFFWEYKYGTTKGTITAGDNMIQNFDRFYSSERVWNEVVGTGAGTNFAGTLDFAPVKPFDSFGQSGIEFVSVASGVAKRIFDGDGTGTLQGDITGTPSTITYSTGVFDITYDASIDASQDVLANYFFNMESASANVPEVNVEISLQPVQAWSRKIKTLWSAESADDLRAMLGMDIESELVGGVASEMTLEIDREIIHDLREAADAGTNKDSFDALVPAGRTPVDHYRQILTKLDKLSTEIQKRTKRGPANWIVCATDVKPILSAMAQHGDFRVAYDVNTAPIAPGMGTGGRPGFPQVPGPQGYGIFEAGTLQDRWRVFVDPFFPTGKALLGLKGTTFLDAGYTYAPYVPMQVTSTFLDPNNFQARKGIRTRYATKLLNADFYGLLNVTNSP